MNKEPEKKIEAMLSDMKTRAPGFNIDDYDAAYMRVNDAAGKIGTQEAHSVFYKIASKFAHPTALLLAMEGSSIMRNTQGLGMRNMQDSIFEIGVKLADKCLTELEEIVKS